jgi:peptidoglycan hydrolase CwlO-like protein
MDDNSFEADIAKLAAEVGELTAKRNKLREKYNSSQVDMARYSYLVGQKERLENEIAKLEGKKDDEDYYDEP